MTRHVSQRQDFPEQPRSGRRPHAEYRFLVQLESAGNVDFEEDPDVAYSRPMMLGVESLEEASIAAQRYRDAYGLGGGNWIPAKIIDTATGDVVAEVSYNGKVWPAVAWRPGLKPLLEAVKVPPQIT